MQLPVVLGLEDHLTGDAVLDRAAGVLALHLAEDPDVGVGAELADVDQRRVADHVEDGGEDGHGDEVRAGGGRRRILTYMVGNLSRRATTTGSSVIVPSTIRYDPQHRGLVAERHDHVVPVGIGRLVHVGRRRVGLGVGVGVHHADDVHPGGLGLAVDAQVVARVDRVHA